MSFFVAIPLCGMRVGDSEEAPLFAIRRVIYIDEPTEEVKRRAGIYEKVVNGVPEKYWNAVLSGGESILAQKNKLTLDEINAYRWSKIARLYGFYHNGLTSELALCFIHKTKEGYYSVKDNDKQICNGASSPVSIKDYIKKNSDKNAIMKQLVQQYQINLMPKGSMVEDFDQLLSLLAKNEDLRKNIHSFKLLASFNDEQLIMSVNNGLISRFLILPKIVIFCAAGKEKAQMVLDEIYKAFEDKQGLNITPRYSEKVTSYIYYQQGLEEDREVPELFEPNMMVHYKSGGEGENFYLKKPAEEKKVVEEQKAEEKKESWWPMSFIKDKYNALRENINVYNAGLLLGVAGTVGIAGYYVYKTWLKK